MWPQSWQQSDVLFVVVVVRDRCLLQYEVQAVESAQPCEECGRADEGGLQWDLDAFFSLSCSLRTEQSVEIG